MKTKIIAYWATTVFVALELLVGGATDLLHGREILVIGDPVVQVITYLGYPVYFLTILGLWKLLGAVALLVPRFPRLKEWAYAGAFFDMTGAAASWALHGDSVSNSIWLILMAVLVLVSWALRPQNRTLGPLFPAKTRAWTRPESSPLPLNHKLFRFSPPQKE